MSFMSESIAEMHEVFDRHNVDYFDLAAIIYLAGPHEIKVSIIYTPGAQLLAGMHARLSGCDATRTLEDVRQQFKASHYGMVRIAPRQPAGESFLTLDALKLHVVAGAES